MPATFRTADADSNTYARYPVKVLPNIVTFTDVDGTTPKLIAQGDTTVLGSRLDLVLISSNDTNSNVFYFYLHDGTNLSPLPFAFVAVPNGSGTDGTAIPVSVLRSTDFDAIVSLDNNGNPYMMLGSGYAIYAAPVLAVSTSKTIQVISYVHDY